MRYKIVFDKPGRIRVRFGAYAFEKELESRIKKLVLSNISVISAEIHAENGGIVICYKKGCRDDIIKLIGSFDFRTLTPLAEDNSAAQRIDADFKNGLIRLGAAHLIRRLLIPAPLRPLFIV